MTQLLEMLMPDVGEGIAEAELMEWHVDVGETVEADAPLCQIQTDKSIVEIPAPATGTVLKRCVEAGDVAQVGELLVIIGDPDALSGDDIGDIGGVGDRSLPEPASQPDLNVFAAAPAQAAGTTGDRIVTVPPTHAGSSGTRTRPLASPRTRRIAARRGIDLQNITGTGPHSRIIEADLEQTSRSSQGLTGVPPQPSTSRTNQVIELRGLRRAIARHMTEALTIPHVTEFREVDATNLLAARNALKASVEAQGLRLSVLPLLLKAVMRALTLQPSMNATFDVEAGTVTQHGGVNLGVATATRDGLLVPVIRDADLLTLTELAREVGRLAERARTRTATTQELTGGSFTVTNFGSFGTWLGNPVIRPQEVGIAGFGRITDKVIAVEGQAVVRPVLPIVVATDHRINDGADLADFVNAIAEAVSQPLLLLS